MSLKDAFNQMLSIYKREVTLTRLGAGGFSVTVNISPSNYMRNLETVEEVTSAGREFVISKNELTKNSIARLKKGDKLIDEEIGTMTISEIREMFDINGEIMGFRLRIS